MNDLESLVRDTLSDERRRVAPPLDVTRWVGTEVRRQRRKHAAIGVAVASVFAVVGAALVVPLVNDEPATYVAGPPPADTGLLPWKPVGSLTEESEVVQSAVEAWEDLADDQPTGDVHLVAGERWDDTEMVLLQSHTDSGAASLALLTTDGGAAGPWELKDTAALPEAVDAQAIVLPADTIPTDAMPRGSGPGSPASLALAPQWRTGPLRTFSPSVGSQLVPAGSGFGDEPSWQPVDRVSGYGWWVPLTMSSPDGLPPATVVLDHSGHGYADIAPVLDLNAASELSALTPSDVSFRLLPGDYARAEELDDIDALIERLGLTGPVEVTVLHTGTGALGTAGSPPSPHQTHFLFAQFESLDEARPVLVAYATTGDDVTCFSQRRVPGPDVTSLPFVGMACPAPVAGGPRRGIQGNEVWASSVLTKDRRPTGLKPAGLNLDVTLIRRAGQSTTRNLGDLSIPLSLTEDATHPVRRYVFTVHGNGPGIDLAPLVWPASTQ